LWGLIGLCLIPLLGLIGLSLIRLVRLSLSLLGRRLTLLRLALLTIGPRLLVLRGPSLSLISLPALVLCRILILLALTLPGGQIALRLAALLGIALLAPALHTLVTLALFF
jgi:hypothetical protein